VNAQRRAFEVRRLPLVQSRERSGATNAVREMAGSWRDDRYQFASFRFDVAGAHEHAVYLCVRAWWHARADAVGEQ